MKREDSTTLKIGDDFSKACAPFEAYLNRLCIHGECRMPCVIWDGEKKRCSLKHQVRLMHRAPRNNGAFNVPADKDDGRILSLLEDICRGGGVEPAFDATGVVVSHVPAGPSRN
jgi:hypothetical protein